MIEESEDEDEDVVVIDCVNRDAHMSMRKPTETDQRSYLEDAHPKPKPRPRKHVRRHGVEEKHLETQQHSCARQEERKENRELETCYHSDNKDNQVEEQGQTEKETVEDTGQSETEIINTTDRSESARPVPIPRRSSRIRREPIRYPDYQMYQMTARPRSSKVRMLDILIASGVLHDIDSEEAEKVISAVMQ